jgi:hypothetical protein
MPRDGGEETQVLDGFNSALFGIVNEGIYFIGRANTSGRYSIQFFNFATKGIRDISTIENTATDFSVSPDGQWILYSQIDQVGSDLMLVENFR